MPGAEESTWVFGYGSLIWGTGAVTTKERRTGLLEGWHREWAWISASRHGAPTCSLANGGLVKGVFLRIDLNTLGTDLEAFRERENRRTEQTVKDVPIPGAVTYFWTMGNNLSRFPQLRGLNGEQLARALAAKASSVTIPGPDGVLPRDYILRVHEFDPDDPITAEIAKHL